MTKKVFHWMLMATVVLGLGMSITSCKDDDDEKSEETKAKEEQEAQQKADAFWDVVGQLTSYTDYTADYANATFEPTIGVPDAGNPTVRVVNTNSMAAAAQRFANLVSAAVDENTTTYEYKNDAVGTLTYTKTNNGQSWATVDVNIKQLPQLQQIIYRAPEQAGQNGSFDGTAYYRFGDVISRKAKDGYGRDMTEYWVCVRPAFGPEGKQESHWISVSPLPKENVWLYESDTNGNSYALPTGIGTNKEQMQNLAEMLYAIINPVQWEINVRKNSGKGLFSSDIKVFNDFSTGSSKLRYHSNGFWQRVQDAWSGTKTISHGNEQKDVWQLVFGISKSQMDSELRSGLNLLYKGYSWWTKSSWNLTLYQAKYRNGEGLNSNMHEVTYTDVKGSMRDNKINIREEYKEINPNLSNRKFFGDDGYRWIIRHATGKELAKMGNNAYDEKQPIAPSTFKPVYVYNAYYYKDAPNNFRDLTDMDLEMCVGSPINDSDCWYKTDYEGDSHYHCGDVYKDENGHRWFVLWMSGASFDTTPYTELVSFEGFTTANDNGRITNAPTRQQVLRVIAPLWYISHEAFKNRDAYLAKNPGLSAVATRHLREFANVDIRRLMQAVEGFPGSRANTMLTSIPYRDETTNKQKVLRLIEESANSKKDMLLWLWEHYPQTPSATEKWQKKFSSDYIYLQDVADQNLVNKWAEDTYARQPIIQKVESELGPVRTPRSAADERAKNVTNYFYNRNTWDTFQYPTDMWNEPLLCIRVTAVYDRGDADYASITVDGHQLTLVHGLDIFTEEEEDRGDDMGPYGETYLGLRRFWENAAAMFYTGDAIYLDGKSAKIPTWKQVWNN